MTRFYPLYVRRSDGKIEVTAKGKRKELNQPTSEQLDQRPDKNGVSDFYREVSIDETKHLDWRRKLGGMLAREMDWKDKSGQAGQGMHVKLDASIACEHSALISGAETGYMLVAFPENYRLYEHVKKTEKDGKTEVKSKTHAAGGNDRQDAYLYGHPAGRKKRYRSPADFFPHLLWLCTDESGDPDNCGCKVCSPEDLADVMPETKTKVKPEAAGQHTFVMAKSENGQGMMKVKQENNIPVPVQRPSSSPRQLIPTTLSPPKSQDQQIDRQYNSFMFRPGELVWFERGRAWGLGTILRRWQTGRDQFHYTVQPLSHPFQHPAPLVKSSHAELRPWLAWSVPRYTNDGLNNMPEPPRYETLDWEGLRQMRYGNGDMEVDGSILAAKGIDSSYTLLQPIRTTETEPGVTETYFEGLYLGAEKMWTGDPLRLHPGTGTDILVLHFIVERTHQTRSATPVSRTTVHLVGDIYQLHQTSHSNPTMPTPASPQNNPQLPTRLTEDLTFRNARSIPTQYTASFWKLTTTNTRVDLNDIKGRWYEASLLLPILQATIFEDSARKGEIREATLWMNSRGDCINSNRPPALPKLPRENNAYTTRLEACGRALPPHAEIKEGVEPPLPDNVDPALEGMTSQSSMEIDPRFETAGTLESDEIRGTRPGQEDMHVVGDGGNLEEFMNLDEPSHDISGFGQDYGSQEAPRGYY
jgi:hypothetical protein